MIICNVIDGVSKIFHVGIAIIWRMVHRYYELILWGLRVERTSQATSSHSVNISMGLH